MTSVSNLDGHEAVVLASQQQTLQTGIVSASAGSAQGAALFEAMSGYALQLSLSPATTPCIQPDSTSALPWQRYSRSLAIHLGCCTAVDKAYLVR